jgi:hypothetical protein
VSTADERPLPGAVPRWEVPGWRERYGVVAGISGRGSDPAAPFDLGLWGSGSVAQAMGRWRSFRGAFPEARGMVMAHQVHGARVLWHEGGAGWTIHEGADGHATAASDLLLLVTVADCVPIYLVAPSRRVVALLHSGWRGTARGILAEGVATLQREAGVEPGELVMHLGVAICGPCYEVGAEVVRGVGREPEGDGPWHVDLREILAAQATALGVAEVTTSGICPSCRGEEFFSHRGSGGADGRMVAYLGLTAHG